MSHRLHARPELGFQERFAHELLTGILEREGFAVERHAHGMETGFVARAGTSGPVIAVMCEYDALPEIGHACGHNLIAAMGLGAGLAAKTVSDRLGGRVVVFGTPAEEGGGGKVFLIEAGGLDGVDAAMMLHGASADVTHMDVVAIERMSVEYSGATAHAAAAPHKGRNALDAAVLGYVNVAALRQHIGAHERVHGVFTHGGTRPNIVPDRAAAEWYVRSPQAGGLRALAERVRACLEAGAHAAQCSMTSSPIGPAYADMIHNGVLGELYRANAARTGRDVRPPGDDGAIVGSTDMGNVSYVVPSIHPMIKVSPSGVSLHTPEFAEYARSEAGDTAVLDGAKALAMTVADLWARPELLEKAKAEFEAAVAARQHRPDV
ncbi:peptidase M20 [Streptosporangium violaceochromogenes]|nr:peptidase M20 [Streptosporangium violaceochromogenes]